MLIVDKSEEIFGLDQHFLPLSQTCQFNQTPETKFEWAKYDSTQKIVKFCPNKKNNNQKMDLGIYEKILFPYLPEQIFDSIEWINPDPSAWFVGQFAKYVLRPQSWFLKGNINFMP